MKYLFIILSFVFCASLSAQKDLDQLLKKYNDNGVPYISVEELAMPKTTAIILDSREFEEYETSHLENAIYIGYNDFDIKKIDQIVSNKNTAIVVYCSLGIRSEPIGEKIKEAGYTNVKNLYGGIFEWKNKEFTVVDSKNEITEKVHAFSKSWSKWLLNGEKVYSKKDKK
jgi:rhodanese-related sulfurtransferase